MPTGCPSKRIRNFRIRNFEIPRKQGQIPRLFGWNADLIQRIPSSSGCCLCSRCSLPCSADARRNRRYGEEGPGWFILIHAVVRRLRQKITSHTCDLLPSSDCLFGLAAITTAKRRSNSVGEKSAVGRTYSPPSDEKSSDFVRSAALGPVCAANKLELVFD
jgi:hypothetical protein